MKALDALSLTIPTVHYSSDSAVPKSVASSKKKKIRRIIVRNTQLGSDEGMWFPGLDGTQKGHRSSFKE